MMERQLRYRASKLDVMLKKSRDRNIHGDNLGGYMLIDIYTNGVIAGSRRELDLEDVELWLEWLTPSNADKIIILGGNCI